MSSGLVFGSASVDWRAETRRQLGLKLVDCGTRHELLPCLALGSNSLRWHEGCAGLELVVLRGAARALALP